MAKIFQLELFIKEMSIWKLPHNSEECDETCVEVNVFDLKEVPICGYVFEKNSTLNRGQNFLFTLNAVPIDKDKVFFNVFKKAFNREKNLLGKGNIPIEKIFSDVFLKTFNGAENNNTNNIANIENSDLNVENAVFNENISQENGAPVVTSKTLSSTRSRYSPISRLTKDVYPVIGADGKQWGSICILMRLTSFGDCSAHPIHIHQGHNEIILQNAPNTAMYKCIQVSDLKRNNLSDQSSRNVCKEHQPMNYSTDLVEASNMCYANSDSGDYDLCPGPPVSPTGQGTEYEEFKAEVNENVLCVRMPKNAGIVRRVYDNNESGKRLKYLEDSENVCNNHIKSIPIVRGNQKYPAHYGVSAFPNKCIGNNLIYDYKQKSKDLSLQCTEKRIQDDNISCPSDVEITRKTDDPKRDVFLLRIGKDAGGKQNEIQLEMRTPKNPFAGRANNKQTTSAQTYDDEFVSSVKKNETGGNKGGKKGGKKSEKKK